MFNIRFPVLMLGAALGSPAARGQTLSDALDTPGPEGWSRVVWRSPEPVTAGGFL